MNFFLDFELIDSIINFSNENIYDASILFFKALNFSVTPIIDSILDGPVNFIYTNSELKVYIDKAEMYYLKNTRSISRIFELEINDTEYNHIKTSKYLSKYISKITFLSVELEDFCPIRSEAINCLTTVLSKIYNNPILVLFKHKDYIALSGQLSFSGNEQKQTEVFLSDWYSISGVDQVSLTQLSLMKYEYQNDNNILEFYSDLVFSISREYQINPDSYEYIKYQVFAPTEDEPYYLNPYEIYQNMNHCKEYGDDFIFNDNTKIDPNEDLFKDDYDIESLKPYDEESSEHQMILEYYLSPDDDSYEEEYLGDEIFKKLGYISDVEYDDPEKLLELINEMDK